MREEAIASARADQLEQLDEDVELQQVLADAARRASAGRLRKGRGTGLPTGRMPDRGVDRPPYPDEVQHTRRYATRLRQAITRGSRQIDKRTPAAGSTAAPTPAAKRMPPVGPSAPTHGASFVGLGRRSRSRTSD